MKKLNVAVIGCGSIARKRHLPEYHSNSQVNIVAVCDVVEERAKEMAEVYGALPFTNYMDAINLAEVDAVSVCLPNYLHASVTIESLDAKKHVLCEKPMAISIEEAEAMNQAAERNEKKLMIAHNQRFVSSHQKAKQLLDSGELGKVYSFRTTFGHGGPENWSIDGSSSWFFNKEAAFVGAMGDLGVHKADLIRYLIGEVSEVGAFVETAAKSNTTVDDNAVCILKMDSGVVGTLTASWSYSTNDNSTVIYCEKGTLQLENDPDYSLKVEYRNGDRVHHKLDKIQTNDDKAPVTTHTIDHFVESVLNDQTPLISGEEGLKSLQVILSALEANETKQIVELRKTTEVY
ncbi:Gfo/Idh/MocA family oxidoreductase [Halobacillus litoralis]|uniref:Gfo/Idh/MocA family protein n=1 Tax=Halobacillus litoralis TaxID=45668 RepID=UPI001CD33AD7|nr:Gfo/Idh/MocA family oxidoreductase [Halobacillus litoralis]MCA0970498.1 Gfo/Idh/MocA family oxidoreductase [Halobacillus litoralis]